MSFADNLRDELNYNDITLKKFSKIVGIPYETMRSYINYRFCTLPNVETAVKIAKALNVTVEYLVEGTPNKNEKIFRRCVAELEKLPKEYFNIVSKLIHMLNELK